MQHARRKAQMGRPHALRCSATDDTNGQQTPISALRPFNVARFALQSILTGVSQENWLANSGKVPELSDEDSERCGRIFIDRVITND